jgi:hypothetical protein
VSGSSDVELHNFKSTNSKEFKDFENSSHNDDDEDVFYDAQDVFDKDVIQMLKLEEH